MARRRRYVVSTSASSVGVLVLQQSKEPALRRERERFRQVELHPSLDTADVGTTAALTDMEMKEWPTLEIEGPPAAVFDSLP
jgi:hypothetical protein